MPIGQRALSANTILSSAQASGWGVPEEGNRPDGCQTARFVRFRCSPPDSGVVPFSEKSPSPIKSDTTSLAASDYHSEARFASIVLETSRGENGTLTTVPTGLADTYEPTRHSLGHAQSRSGRDRMGVSRAEKAAKCLYRKHSPDDKKHGCLSESVNLGQSFLSDRRTRLSEPLRQRARPEKWPDRAARLLTGKALRRFPAGGEESNSPFRAARPSPQTKWVSRAG